MRFDYISSPENLSNSVLICPDQWEEFREINLSKFLNLINPTSNHFSSHYKLKGETNISNLFSNHLINKRVDIYEKALDFILSDYRWVMLCERRWVNSSIFYVAKIRELVIGCCNYIEDKKIKYLFSVNVPHCIETWLLAMILENIYYGEVYIFDISAIPGFISIYKGIDKLVSLELDNRFECADITAEKYALDYLNASRSDSSHRDEKGMLTWMYNLDGYKAFSIYKPIHIPQRLVQKIYAKYIFKKYLRNMQKGSKIQNNSAVYFMHYQPESSSLPMGKSFVEQTRAINTLRLTLPKEMKIYVKEHPTTYIKPIDPRFRPPQYYEIISSIKGVEFVDPMYPSYDLIDQTKIVSTLNGKVGFQGLLRNKPCICFAPSSFRDHSGCHFYKDSKGLEDFLRNIDNVDFQSSTDYFLNSLKNKCVSGFEVKNGILPTIKNSIHEKARRVGIIKIIKTLFGC